MVAAYAASRIVYAEGLGWLPRISEIRDVGEAVQIYLQQERRMYEHIQHLDHAAVQDREELRDIVAQAGCRYMTERMLGLH
jgi:glutamate dehydrogenase